MLEIDYGSNLSMVQSMIAESKKDVLQSVQGRHMVVACATTGSNIAILTGILTIDGYTTVDQDLVLVKDQTDTKQNGVYICNASGSWNRYTADITKMPVGSTVTVQNGTTNAGQIFVSQSSSPKNFVFGVNGITYKQYAGKADVMAAIPPAPPAQVGGGIPRQTVISGPVNSSGYANFIAGDTANNGSSAKLIGGPVYNFAYGFNSNGTPNDILYSDANNVAGSWNGVVNHPQMFLAVNLDPSTGTRTFVSTPVQPQYGYSYDITKNSLLHFEGVNGSTSFTDDYGSIWTVAGSAQISTATYKFGTSSLKLNGTTDFIKSTGFTNLPNTWTIEAWVNTASLASVQSVFSFVNTNNYGLRLDIATTGKTSLYAAASLGTSWGIASAVSGVATMAINTWNHVAVTFDGNAYRVFVNGILDSIVFSATGITSLVATYIGLSGYSGIANGATASQYFNGYVDEFRLSPCVRYAQSFAVPTAQFVPSGDFYNIPLGKMQTISGAGPIFTDVQRLYVGESGFNASSALLHFEGTNGSQSIPDDYGNEWQVYGTAQLSTTQAKFGSGSLSCNGTTDYIKQNNIAIGNSFTIEGWFYVTSLAAARGLFSIANTNLYAFVNTTGTIGTNLANGTATVAANTWFHVAISYDGVTWRVFVNGVLDRSGSSNYGANNNSYITLGYGNTYYLTGYADEFRISQYARYTATFTPSTLPFVADENKAINAVSYAYQGKYDSSWYPVAVNTTYTKTHNIGVAGIITKQLYSPNGSDNNSGDATSYYYDGTNYHGYYPNTNNNKSVSIQTAANSLTTNLNYGYFRTLCQRAF